MKVQNISKVLLDSKEFTKEFLPICKFHYHLWLSNNAS